MTYSFAFGRYGQLEVFIKGDNSDGVVEFIFFLMYKQ